MFIYKIVNLINNKIYVGKTEKSLAERFEKHIKKSKYANKLLYTAFIKYGVNNFQIIKIEECGTKKELSEKEIYWIDKLNSLTPNGYNVTIGGDGGDTYSNNPRKIEIINDISAKLTGKNNPFFGKKHTKESLQKMSLVHQGMSKGEKNGMYGKKHSEFSKQKMRDNHKGGKPKGYKHTRRPL